MDAGADRRPPSSRDADGNRPGTGGRATPLPPSPASRPRGLARRAAVRALLLAASLPASARGAEVNARRAVDLVRDLVDRANWILRTTAPRSRERYAGAQALFGEFCDAHAVARRLLRRGSPTARDLDRVAADVRDLVVARLYFDLRPIPTDYVVRAVRKDGYGFVELYTGGRVLAFRVVDGPRGAFVGDVDTVGPVTALRAADETLGAAAREGGYLAVLDRVARAAARAREAVAEDARASARSGSGSGSGSGPRPGDDPWYGREAPPRVDPGWGGGSAGGSAGPAPGDPWGRGDGGPGGDDYFER